MKKSIFLILSLSIVLLGKSYSNYDLYSEGYDYHINSKSFITSMSYCRGYGITEKAMNLCKFGVIMANIKNAKLTENKFKTYNSNELSDKIKNSKYNKL